MKLAALLLALLAAAATLALASASPQGDLAPATKPDVPASDQRKPAVVVADAAPAAEVDNRDADQLKQLQVSTPTPTPPPAPAAFELPPAFKAKMVKVFLKSRPQTMHVYPVGGGAPLVHKISSGKAGYGTPVAKYNVLSKNAAAFSNTYRARLPYAIRMGVRGAKRVYTGINLHIGKVTGRPASHGCIRQFFSGAIQLFESIPWGLEIHVVDEEAPEGFAFTDHYDKCGSRSYLKRGDRAEDCGGVLTLQRLLQHAGEISAAQPVTPGVYDEATYEAVRRYQTKHSLERDGIAGDGTLQKLVKHLNHGF